MALNKQNLEGLEEQNCERETAERWLKSKQIKKLLGLSESALQKLRREGNLPFTKLGGMILYDYYEILSILKRNRRSINE